MMHTMTLTAKRQATLPVALCEELGVAPGDKITLERREERGETLWVLHSKKQVDWSWLGAARKYASGKSHRWSDIERSIAAAWGRSSDEAGHDVGNTDQDTAQKSRGRTRKL